MEYSPVKVTSSFLLSILFFATACGQKTTQLPNEASWQSIQSTWAGAAELNHYQLKQERYGQIHDGTAVLIFTREPFLEDRQVKDESGLGNFQVLKMNSLRHFLTGAYPYRTMVSVFQPFEKESTGQALKVSTSIQEWCGHSFQQTNRRDGSTKTEVKSYYEKEDNTSYVEKASILLEDEVWTALRLNPKGLPVGKIQMIRGSLASRLSHQEPISEAVQASWLPGKSSTTLIYEITYQKSGRTLAIEIQKDLPYGIQGWKEHDSEGLISEGTLVKRESNVDYWNYNGKSKGKKLRKRLKL